MDNKQTTDKKKWSKPELTVLVRNKPEEAVLVGCKWVWFSGPTNQNIGCLPYPLCNSCVTGTGS